MTAQHEFDLLETIDELLTEQDSAYHDERRGGQRHGYDCVQLLAPYDGHRLPTQEEFRQVQCRDLSPTGFSFLAYRQPATEFLLVALGAVPFKFFVAKIIHVRASEHDVNQSFLIGCRFVRRVVA